MANPYYNEAEWRSALEEAARKAADAEVKTLYDVHGLKLDKEAQEKKYRGYLERLKKAYPYDKIEYNDIISIKEYDADSLRGWLNNIRGYRSPTEYAASKEAEKYMSLLKGVAEDGQDWYTMGSQQLKEEANRLGLGFDFRNKKAFADLLKRLQDYQLQYDRAQLLKQFQDSGANYWMAKLFYPSMTQEIENAIATGEGGDDETLKKLGVLDAGTNLAMALAPGLSVAKVNPTMMGLIDAGLQGVAEAGRQYGKEAMSKTGQEADLGQATAATLLGGTRPALAQGAASIGTRFPGQFMKDLSRGAVRGARTGDPAKLEGARIASAVKLYNEELAPKMKALESGSHVGTTLFTDTKNRYKDAINVPKMAKIFGVSPDAEGKYNASQILGMYKMNTRPSYQAVVTNPGVIEEKLIPTTEFFTNPKGKREILLGQDNYDMYKQLFPMASEGFDANRAAFGLGRGIGALAAQVGGRVEPIIKTDVKSLWNNKNVQAQYTGSYKDESWFKKLKNANPSAAKVLEEAMKKKEEEE
jgi:hypothetical protein